MLFPGGGSLIHLAVRILVHTEVCCFHTTISSLLFKTDYEQYPGYLIWTRNTPSEQQS